MSCSFADKVSMLVDGEFSATEIREIGKHIINCLECQNLEKDFMFFRSQIKLLTSDIQTEEAFVFPNAGKQPFWKKISFTIPVFTIFILVLVGLSLWMIKMQISKNSEAGMETAARRSITKIENHVNKNSLARYDSGGRAEIFVVSQQIK